jgi:hypothetical protein
MKKNNKQSPKPKAKHEKPVKLDMSFDEAMKRIVRVKPAKNK